MRWFWMLMMWLVIPAGVACLGYFVIGPNIGRVPALERGAERVTQIIQNPGLAAQPKQEEKAEEKPKPKVTVTVQEAEGRKRRSRARVEEVERTAPEAPSEAPAPESSTEASGRA